MVQLTEKLYVGKCSELSTCPASGCSLIFVCHWPCSRAQATMPELVVACPEAGKAWSEGAWIEVFHLDVMNFEIPNYRVDNWRRHLDMLDRCLEQGDVYLLSEKGESRAPSLALLWMAMRGGLISRSSFGAARADFVRMFPDYLPWPGWVIFFEQEWESFLAPAVTDPNC